MQVTVREHLVVRLDSETVMVRRVGQLTGSARRLLVAFQRYPFNPSPLLQSIKLLTWHHDHPLNCI